MLTVTKKVRAITTIDRRLMNTPFLVNNPTLKLKVAEIIHHHSNEIRANSIQLKSQFPLNLHLSKSARFNTVYV